MEQKSNLSLIARITSIFTGKEEPKPMPKRGDTTDTGVMGNVFDWYYQNIKLERTRLARYMDYEIMDEEYPEISTALDLYGDNATKPMDDVGTPFQVKSKDPKVQKILDEVVKRLDLYETIWDTARSMGKMGDEFDEIIADSNQMIVRQKNLPAKTLYVETDEYGRLKDKPYVQKDEATQQLVAEFEPWQIVHWKNGGMKRKYGDSILKSIRRVYKQLQMMEDGMVVGRLTRSHLRYKILVDVDGMEKDEAVSHVKSVKTEFKKKRLINTQTGQMEMMSNPLSAEEDFFLGVTKDSKADVASLQGAMNLGNIRDVEYFQTKLFAGLKVPKAFVGLEKDVKAKATIVEEDIQFARTVGRLRRGLRRGLTQICNRELVLNGIAPSNGVYEIKFAVISMIDELRKWTIEKIKAEVAKVYRVDIGLLSDEFVFRVFLGLNDEEITKLKNQEVPPPPASKLVVPGTPTGTPSLRLAGMQATGGSRPTAPKQVVSAMDQIDKNPIVTYRMMTLLEDLRDLIDIELER